jgi:subtilisin family serine protease
MSTVSSANRRLLIELPSSGGQESLAQPTSRPGLESVLRTPRRIGPPTEWVATRPARPSRSEHPWDEAHRAVQDPSLVGLESVAAPIYAEPDFVQRFPYRGPDDDHAVGLESASPCRDDGPNSFWPPPAADLRFAWHLEDGYSGLRSARQRVGEQAGGRVRIAHLDTGYDPNHPSRPQRLLTELQRNFAGGDDNDATDPGSRFPLQNVGHGTATLALLAGARLAVPGRGFDDFLGGAPFAEIVPVRIAESVIHFETSSMAQGIDYAVQSSCRVLSVSMGGVPARAWADAVNRAYEAGVALFAAAGNRFGPSPPTTIVYPARFNRVVAVCGVTADGSPYYRSGWHPHMQGCFGPAAKMTTALAAYTPNTPWAVMGCGALVTTDGGGTSAATPQAAAAAALWLAANAPQGEAPSWRHVEAVRKALFSSADKDNEGEQYFGQGLLKAHKALDVPFDGGLEMTPPDSVSFRWLRLLGVLETVPEEPVGRELMYEVEALQVYLQSGNLLQIADGKDPMTETLPTAKQKQLLAAMRDSPLVSNALRQHLTELVKKL